VSTIELADRVLFVDQGRLVAAGRHDDLRTTNPAYARIVQAYETGEAA
jgi:ABC-type multidrug transport system fused ATPase/permease subunit